MQLRGYLLITGLMVLIVSTASLAREGGGRLLSYFKSGQEWNAVGRLDLGTSSFCTGSLIAPDLVLTAGHCLFDKRTGERLDHTEMTFLAGWKNGQASAVRDVRWSVVHPEFTFSHDVTTSRVHNDLALLELSKPIHDKSIRPFGTAERPLPGDSVGVVSYALEDAEAPSLQEVCDVLTGEDGLLITSCQVDFGGSGAPIFVLEDGDAEIVSVVSAKASADGQNVSLGTSLAGPLADLQEALRTRDTGNLVKLKHTSRALSSP